MTESGQAKAGLAKPDTQRLFFAIWPDEATRDALNRTGKWLHQHWGGRRMRADTLHLTLAFLGDVPATRVDALKQGIDAIPVGTFELMLDRPGHWPHNHIGWLGLHLPVPQLGVLVEVLRTQLRELDFTFDARPHTPHVTLLRKAPGGPPVECTPVNWPVDGFVLVASNPNTQGAHYDVIRRWRIDSEPQPT